MFNWVSNPVLEGRLVLRVGSLLQLHHTVHRGISFTQYLDRIIVVQQPSSGIVVPVPLDRRYGRVGKAMLEPHQDRMARRIRHQLRFLWNHGMEEREAR